MMKKLARLTLSTLAITAICLSVYTAPMAHALSISPIRYELVADPGEVVTKEMTLVNETKNAQTLYASFANFEAEGDSGSPSFNDAPVGLATWLRTDQASITLAPGAQKEVSFSIAVPVDAEAGGHFAAVFWGTSPGALPGELSVGAKTGMLILLTVTGDIEESAGLIDFKLQQDKHWYKELPVGFEYRFSNQGNDRVKPTGSVVIRSILGWVVEKVEANPYDGNVLPGTTRKFSPEWVKRDTVEVRAQQDALHQAYSFKQNVRDQWHNFAVGVFQAKVVATFGTSDQSIKSPAVFFVVFPLELLLVVCVIGIPVVLILRLVLRRYNSWVIKKAQNTMQAE